MNENLGTSKKIDCIEYSLMLYRKKGLTNFNYKDFIEILKNKYSNDNFIEKMFSDLYGFRLMIEGKPNPIDISMFWGKVTDKQEGKTKIISTPIVNDGNSYSVPNNANICEERETLIHALINLSFYASNNNGFNLCEINLEELKNNKIIVFAPEYIDVHNKAEILNRKK